MWSSEQRCYIRSSLKQGSGLNGMQENWRVWGSVHAARLFLFLACMTVQAGRICIFCSRTRTESLMLVAVCVMIRPDWWSLSVKCSLWLCLGVVLPAPCLVPFPPSFITGPAPSSLWFSSTWKGSDPWRLLTLGHGTCPDFCSSACSLNFCLALILICLWTQSPGCRDSYMIALGAHAHKSSLLICKYILVGLH